MLWVFLALVALTTVATLWRASSREAAAERQYPPAGQFITAAGQRVHYVEAGSGEQTIVLIHGASGSVNDWTFDLMDRLSDRYRVIAFDRPGLGYTPALSRNVPPREQAEILAEAARALDVTSPVVVGHSYGGSVALAWAVYQPDTISGLVVLAGASNPWQGGDPRFYQALSGRVTGPIMAAAISAWVPDQTVQDAVEGVFLPQAMPPGYDTHFGGDLGLNRARMQENARQRNGLLPHIEAMAPLYPAIDVPTEILHGDADITVPLQVHSVPLSQQIPDANLVVLEGIGHMPHHTNPEDTAQAIDRAATRARLR